MNVDPSGLSFSMMGPMNDFALSNSYGAPGFNLLDFSLNRLADKFISDTANRNLLAANNYTPTQSNYKVSVMVNNNGMVGTHAGLITTNGKEQILYDPNGSFTWGNQRAGSGEYFYTDNVSDNNSILKSYINKQKIDDGPKVYLSTYTVTKSEYEAINSRIDAGCATLLPYCSYCVSSVISGIGPFKKVDAGIRFPSNLLKQLPPSTGRFK